MNGATFVSPKLSFLFNKVGACMMMVAVAIYFHLLVLAQPQGRRLCMHTNYMDG